MGYAAQGGTFSHEQLTHILEYLPNAVMVVELHPAGAVRFVNQAFQQLFGYT